MRVHLGTYPAEFYYSNSRLHKCRTRNSVSTSAENGPAMVGPAGPVPAPMWLWGHMLFVLDQEQQQEYLVMCSATKVMSEPHTQYVLLVVHFDQFKLLTGENSYIGMVTIKTYYSLAKYIGSTPNYALGGSSYFRSASHLNRPEHMTKVRRTKWSPQRWAKPQILVVWMTPGNHGNYQLPMTPVLSCGA